jgi:hypothetical protein
VHANITKAPKLRHESAVGAAAHYLIGATLALTYPAFYLISGTPLPASHLFPGLVWGLATALLPWLVLYPAFGWGFFGRRAPGGIRPILSPMVTHLVYGLGLGIFLNVWG